MDLTGTWDDLRKQARKLEGQLDEQLSSYRRLINRKFDSSEEQLEAEIEKSLQQLQNINSQMQAWFSSGSSDIVSHTLARHLEILQDLSQEFKRLRVNLRAKREHEALVQNFTLSKSGTMFEDTGDLEQQSLLKEQATLNRSTGQVDSVLNQAQATLSALTFQRSTFGSISSKISNVSSRLPTVNNILSSIHRRKSMDTVILSLVASACTVFILIYWLTK
eukprot:TRINITY_DN10451_c0_g1_i1.p1 TRINITY_DN10451_c0_g1~~TRINITY_DN10451_c0_g1_i1.p1  ORF type:complete len:220 (+),score=36.29 TRINITY_DN10451_c0_g1_i1:176-835(+)